MLAERKFPVKDKAQIFLGFSGVKYRATNRREVKWRRIEGTM